jgi:hypothetical protein
MEAEGYIEAKQSTPIDEGAESRKGLAAVISANSKGPMTPEQSLSSSQSISGQSQGSAINGASNNVATGKAPALIIKREGR